MNRLDIVVDIVSIIVVLLPISFQFIKLISALTKNKRMELLSDRALIIVRALQQDKVDNIIKKQRACEKLSQYANEAGIPMTIDQVDDYIESAVNLLKEINNGTKD